MATMTNEQAIAFTYKHIEGMQSFVETLQGELLTSPNLDKLCVRMKGLGMPLAYQMGHFGDVLDAYQTGTLHGTLTDDKDEAQKVARCVRDGKGNLGEVVTYEELLQRTIENQQESIKTCLESIDAYVDELVE